jgi:hypothetical protein
VGADDESHVPRAADEDDDKIYRPTYSTMPPLTEKQVMRVFNAHKKRLIKQLGSKSTSDKQLTDTGKLLLGPRFQGAFPQNHTIKTTPKVQYLILNVDTRGKPGSHWVGVVKNNKTFYVFDSFGRTSRKLLPIFSRGKLVIDSEYDAEQFGSSEVCGQLCICWLMTVRQLGIRNALKV